MSHATAAPLGLPVVYLVDDEDVQPEWLTSLADRPRVGAVRSEVRALAGDGRKMHAMA